MTRKPAKNPEPGRIRIGISGWRYRGWRGVFYPKGLQQRRELEFASRIFPSIEINGTFYSLQRPEFFRQWAAETPDDFLFALKGGRFITHMRKLLNVETAVANFFASGVLALGSKLGPILWQFPPQMKFDPARFAAFFDLLPRTQAAAAQLAERCDERLLSRSCLTASCDLPLRHAVEIRHDSFATPAFIDLLRRHNIGFVVADTVEWPLLFDVTSDFVYLRLHGSEQLYASGYESDAIDLWARRILALATGRIPEGPHAHTPLADQRPRDVFVYFDNDIKVRAPFDAQALQARIETLRHAPREALASHEVTALRGAGPSGRTD
jgi:uncharacterized protein YecE (DUF72 family)